MTLKYKLALGLILLAGGGIFAVSQFSYRFIERTMRSELESKATLLAQHFVKQYGEAVRRKDEAELLKGLMELLKDDGVLDGTVLGTDGVVIAHTDIQQVGRVRKDWAEPLTRSGKDFLVQVSSAAAEPRLDIFVLSKAPGEAPAGEAFFMEPDGAGPADAVGAAIVGIGLKMQPLHKLLSSIRKGIMFISLLTLAATLLFSMILSVLIMRPLGRLMTAIGEISSGNLDHQVEARSGDEIGEVAQAFNKMTVDLKKAKGELERKITELGESYRELHETQGKVVRSERLAAIGKLASGVGHELRNPLAAINNALYYIGDALKGTTLVEQDPTLTEFINLANREILSATHIITDLLDFARGPKLVLQPSGINELLAQAKGALTIPPGVLITETLAQDLPRIMADGEKLRQVFTNLMQNAIQAMPKGGEIRVATRLEGAATDSRLLLVEFQDTGDGISQENLDKIFEPLFTTKAKGTGLGLAISREIVEKHGGRLTAASQEGKGATFTVHLPVVEGKGDQL